MASEDRDFDSRFDPAFQRAFEGTVIAPDDTAGAMSEFRSERGRGEDVAPTLRGNPWVPTLWVIAAVFIFAGIAGQTAAEVIVAAPTADSALLEYVIPALLRALSPWLLVAGLFAGIGVIFLHAVRWRAPLE